ncbi:MAG: response regulator, partial [Armatimonadota bacterium]|nr:response regulator [Armatimonadota bacterium]
LLPRIFAKTTFSMYILFVDDLPDTGDVFRLAFGMHGHATRLATTGIEAVDAVREEHFDAIVMDIEMPQMNGWDAVRGIRKLPNGQDVPIIMFTAYGGPHDRHRALSVGADDLLQKPVLPQQLLARIAQLIIERSRPDNHLQS